nr:hypothetical protein [uncultured Cohaesibacter sp.]
MIDFKDSHHRKDVILYAAAFLAASLQDVLSKERRRYRLKSRSAIWQPATLADAMNDGFGRIGILGDSIWSKKLGP